MAKTETPYKAIKEVIANAKKTNDDELNDLKSKLTGYEVKRPAAEAAANEAAKGNNIKKFGDANRTLTEIEDAIMFYSKKIEALEGKPVFEDAEGICKDIEKEQASIDADALSRIMPLLTEAYEIARDSFDVIMDGNKLKEETGVLAMNMNSRHFYRPDQLKRYRDDLRRLSGSK